MNSSLITLKNKTLFICTLLFLPIQTNAFNWSVQPAIGNPPQINSIDPLAFEVSIRQALKSASSLYKFFLELNNLDSAAILVAQDIPAGANPEFLADINFYKSLTNSNYPSNWQSKFGLTDPELKAIRQYTNEAAEANGPLRSGKTAGFADLLSGLDKLPNYDGIAYRGFSNGSAYGTKIFEGDYITDLGIMSASSSKFVARGFINSAESVSPDATFFIIRSRTGKILGPESVGNGAELAFNSKTLFKVNKISSYYKQTFGPKGIKNRIRIVEIEELPTPPQDLKTKGVKNSFNGVNHQFQLP